MKLEIAVRVLSSLVARGALILLLAVTIFGAVDAQRGGGSFAGSGSGGSRPISPAVVSAFWSHDGDDHVPVLEFLVLFRGSPGWFIASGPGTNGFNFAGSGAHSMSHAFATSGNVTVSIDGDSSMATKKLTVMAHLVTILDRQIAPEEVNVVLVDGVDSDRPIVETRAIETRLLGEGDALARMIRRSADLFSFLQCDTPLPDAVPGASYIQLRIFRVIPMACAEMRP